MVSMPSMPGASSLVSLLKGDGYPPASFHFKVVLSATLGLADTSFQEVSGIGSEMELEEVVEGGENRYVHRLPKGVKHPKLVLKRGIGRISSPLVIWCKSVLELGYLAPVAPMPVLVFLQNEKRLPSRAWFFANAYPVNWKVDPFNSTKNEVAIEEIELSYNYTFRVI